MKIVQQQQKTPFGAINFYGYHKLEILFFRFLCSVPVYISTGNYDLKNVLKIIRIQTI